MRFETSATFNFEYICNTANARWYWVTHYGTMEADETRQRVVPQRYNVKENMKSYGQSQQDAKIRKNGERNLG